MAWKHVRARTGPVCHCVSVLGVSSKCWHMSPLGNVPSPHSPSHLTVLTTSPHILQVRPSRLASISSEILPPMSPFLGDRAPPITPALLHPSPPPSSPNILFSSFSSFFPFFPLTSPSIFTPRTTCACISNTSNYNQNRRFHMGSPYTKLCAQDTVWIRNEIPVMVCRLSKSLKVAQR